MPIKLESIAETGKSALEKTMDNLFRLSYFANNVLKGAVELVKGNTVPAAAELLDAVDALTKNDRDFTPGVKEQGKSVAIAAGVSAKSIIAAVPMGQEYLNSIDKAITEKIARRGELASIQDEKPIIKVKKGLEGERIEEHIYPSIEEDRRLQLDIAALNAKKWALETSPAGVVGLATDIFADPLTYLKPLKALTSGAKTLGEGTEQLLKVANVIEEHVPQAIKETSTYKNSVTRVKDLLATEAAPILKGERPLSSAPVVKHIAKMFDISAGITEVGTTAQKEALENAVRNYVGTAQTFTKEGFEELTPILQKLMPAVKNEDLKRNLSYALMAMQDNTQALMSDFAETVDLARNAYKRSALADGTMRMTATEIEERSFRYADDLLKKHNYDVESIRKSLINYASDADLVDYSVGKIPKDTYMWTKDRVPQEMWDRIMNSSMEELGKGFEGVNPAELQQGVRELLNHYKAQGVLNEHDEIIKSLLPNYSPRVWEEIQKEGVSSYVTAQKFAKGGSPWFTKHRKFATFTEAQNAYAEAGLQLNTRFDEIAATYTQKSAQARATESFVSEIERALNTSREGFSKELQGMVDYVTKGPNRTDVAKVWRKYFLNNFKISQLYGFPAYHARNIIDNMSRTFIQSGSEGLRLRNQVEAMTVLGENAAHMVKLGQESRSGAEMFEKALRLGVIRTDNVRLDQALSTKQLLRHYSKKANIGRFLPFTPEFAQMADNVSRMNMWLVETRRLVKDGMEFEKAAVSARNIVSKAHMSSELAGPVIDALSNFVPFVKFQAGSWAFYGKALAENPGRVANLFKLVRSANQQILSEEEQNGLAPFIKENLRILISKDPSGVSKYLTSFGLSVENINQLMAFTSDGNFDIGRTIEKGIAQTVMINALYGLASGRDPFLGEELNSYRGKKTNKMLYDNELLRSLVGGIRKIPVHKDGEAPRFRYEKIDPKQYLITTQILHPLVNAGILTALSQFSPSQNLAAIVGAVTSTRMVSTAAAMTDLTLTLLIRACAF